MDRDDEPQITDLSSIEPENIKDINETILRSDEPYDVLGHQTDAELRRRIWSVRNGDLRQLLETFPTDEPFVDQCVYWMHAMVGKYFFPDGNHRTAFLVLRRLLRESGIESGEWPAIRSARTQEESRRVRRELPTVRLDTLYERDELFRVWRRYFEEVITEEVREE